MTKQKYPILDPATSIATGSGSQGTFICDQNNPFDWTTLTGEDKGKMGHAIQFFSEDGAPVTVGVAVVNGLAGNTTFLDGKSWPAGQGFAFEVESMTITGAGYCQILLKETEVKY